jgi:hypothetical protein
VIFKEYDAVDKLLCKQIIEAVNYDFISALSDGDDGFSMCTAHMFMTHLYDNYGTITPTEAKQNKEELKAPWNPADPLESLWTRTTEIRQIAIVAEDPISDTSTLADLLTVFEQTGLFTDALKEWALKPAADRTLLLFKAFIAPHDEYRREDQTAANAGYQGFNVTTPAPVAPSPAPVARAAAVTPPPAAPGTMSYCWSHGATSNPMHSSMSCEHKKAGHQDTATMSNMQGGCNLIRRARGEQQAAVFNRGPPT